MRVAVGVGLWEMVVFEFVMGIGFWIGIGMGIAFVMEIGFGMGIGFGVGIAFGVGIVFGVGIGFEMVLVVGPGVWKLLKIGVLLGEGVGVKVWIWVRIEKTRQRAHNSLRKWIHQDQQAAE